MSLTCENDLYRGKLSQDSICVVNTIGYQLGLKFGHKITTALTFEPF